MNWSFKFKVKCTDNAACSGNPVTVMIADECPDCPPVHFDLSGTALGSMANPGQADNLRNYGQLNVQYRRYMWTLTIFLGQLQHGIIFKSDVICTYQIGYRKKTYKKRKELKKKIGPTKIYIYH